MLPFETKCSISEGPSAWHQALRFKQFEQAITAGSHFVRDSSINTINALHSPDSQPDAVPETQSFPHLSRLAHTLHN